jgi:hypothetical protein
MATRYNYTGGIVTNGLVLNLDAAKTDSYPGTGTTWRDISGNNNNGTLTNGPTFSGIGKQAAIVFDGVDDFVNCGTNSSLNLSSSYTLSIWLNTTATFDKAIVQRYSFSGGLYPGYALSLNRSQAGQMDLYTGETWYTNKGSNINNGNWNNITITVNSTSCVFYQNLTPSSFTVAASTSNPTDTLFIGSTEGTNNMYSGNISIVQIYNRALSADEVSQNFNALRGRYGI